MSLKEENNMRYLELYVFVVKRYKGLGKADRHPRGQASTQKRTN
jgi:hypothetical protein